MSSVEICVEIETFLRSVNTVARVGGWVEGGIALGF